MSFGFGFGARSGANTIWSPASLFAQNEPGVWYDPSDMTTLFQDAAGTTPVTAVEQPVGLMLDKSRGPSTNGAYRYNLLTYTEQFDDAAWVKTDTTATANTVVAPDGALTADKLIETATLSVHRITAPVISVTSGTAYTATIYLKAGERSVVQYSSATNSFPSYYANFNLAAGVVSAQGGSGSAAIASVGNGWYRCIVTQTAGATGSNSQFRWQIQTSTTAANNETYTGDGFSGVFLWGAQLQTGSTATTYQKITADWPSTLAGTYATSLTTSRPVLTARVNLLLNTEFAGAVAGSPGTAPTSWLNFVSTGAISSSSTGIRFVTSSTRRAIYQSQTAPANAVYKFLATVNITTSLPQIQQLLACNSAPVASRVYELDGVIVPLTTVPSSGEHTIALTVTANGTGGTLEFALGIGIQANTTGDVTFYTSSLTTADQASLGYQRVNTATDYDTVGFPMWLKADGVDDYMVTGTLAAPVNLNLTSTDKVTVATGVRKLSDAAAGIVTEFSAIVSNNGSFNISAPPSVNPRFGVASKGTVLVALDLVTLVAAPITAVLTSRYDISGDLLSLKANSGVTVQSTADQGTGNYGTYPLYQFRRGGTSVPFNGLSAGLTVVGRTLTAAELSQLETYYQQKTKAY